MLSDKQIADLQEHARREAISVSQREIAELVAERAALRERLAGWQNTAALAIEDKRLLEQRELQARAIIERVGDALWDDDETLHFVISAPELMDLDLDHGDSVVRRLVTAARAWLADRAEQRAASQEEASES